MSEALSQGSVGVLDDMWAFLRWGFRLEDVVQPAALFVGDTDQILDPAMVEVFTGRLPNASKPTSWKNAGHYAVFSHWEEFLRPLTRG